jgi:hypothetical protein
MRTTDEAKEHRLELLREQAKSQGRVEAPGVRPVGAPFPSGGALPEASAAAGYYGLPLLKDPPWIWTVPLYFFVGGAAGASAIITTAARVIEGETPLVRSARWIAVAGAALSPALLIADLGRPARFLNMLRVIKPQSPMSVGVWTLVAFSVAVDTAAGIRYVLSSTDAPRPVRAVLNGAGAAADAAGAIFGSVIATYTGVLVGVSAIPVWSSNVRLLPFHFGASGLASASAMLELQHDHRALHRIGAGAAAAETIVGLLIELRSSRTQEPLKRGASGRLTRLGGFLSGPASLAIRLLAGRSRHGRRAAAIASVVGSVITRYAWVAAGKQSARDPRTPVGLRQPAPALNSAGDLTVRTT